MFEMADFSGMTVLTERLPGEIVSNPDRAYTKGEQAERIDKEDS